MNKIRFSQIALFAAPVLCFFLAGGIGRHQWGHIQQLQQDIAQTDKQIADLNRVLTAAGNLPQLAHLPTAEQSSKEQPTFLDSLRAYADQAHVKLTRWSNTNAPAYSGAPPSGDKPADATMPPDVMAIASSVEAVGSYSDLRQFLYALRRSPRLLNLTDIKWTRDDTWPQTHLTFTLTRYTAPPGKATIHDDAIQVQPVTQPHPPVPTAPTAYPPPITVSHPVRPVAPAAASGKL